MAAAPAPEAPAYPSFAAPAGALDFYAGTSALDPLSNMGGYGLDNDAMSSMAPPPSGDGEFGEEPPLLEELGVNFTDIWAKTLFILLPNKQIPKQTADDVDLGGPLLFCLLLGVALLLRGKVQFGFIYGFAVFGAVAIWLVLNVLHDQGACCVVPRYFGCTRG